MDKDRVKGKKKELEGKGQQKWGEAKDKARDAWDDAKDKADDVRDDRERDRDEEPASRPASACASSPCASCTPETGQGTLVHGHLRGAVPAAPRKPAGTPASGFARITQRGAAPTG